MCKQIWQQGPAEQTLAYTLPITNYPQFILNQYQEVGQKPVHTVTAKKKAIKRVLYVFFRLLTHSHIMTRFDASGKQAF